MPYCRRGEEAAISMAKLLDTFGYARAQPQCNHSNHRTQRNGPQGCCCLRRVPSGTDTAYSLVLRIRQYRRIQLPRGSDHPCARPRPGVQRHRVAPAERRAAIAERPIAANHFRRYSARAPTLPHMHRDWAHPCHICTGTGLAPDGPCHICTRMGLPPGTQAHGCANEGGRARAAAHPADGRCAHSRRACALACTASQPAQPRGAAHQFVRPLSLTSLCALVCAPAGLGQTVSSWQCHSSSAWRVRVGGCCLRRSQLTLCGRPLPR